MKSALSEIYSEGEARSIVKIVFEDEFGIYSTESSKMLSDQDNLRMNQIQQRLLKNEPIQYILEQADFYGLKFKVNQSVLIPRQETEELVYWIMETLKSEKREKTKLLDIGTGSGCIPISLKANLSKLEVWGLDISANAIEVAESNAERNKVFVQFFESDILNRDMWEGFPFFDLIVSNPPYIPYVEKVLMPVNVLKHEPALALFVENENPLIFYETIAEFASKKLNSAGWLFFECNEYNAVRVFEMLKTRSFEAVQLKKDINGKNRMIRAKK